MKPVIVVGAGVSGLAAAVSLVRQKIPVLLLEQKPFPGGRAYSFSDATTGTVIDNGQHVLIAGYTRTMRFLEQIGMRGHLSVQRTPSLLFHHPEKGFGRFRIPPLPPPLHLAAAILTYPLLPIRDRLAILRAREFIGNGTHEREEEIAQWTVDEWLDRIGQSAEARQSFWEPLAVSIMNEHTSKASALLFARTLRQAFMEHWSHAALAIPTVGLSTLYALPASEFIERQGGVVRFNADVESVLARDGHVTGIALRTGETIECAACILTAPSDHIRALLPDELQQTAYLSSLSKLPVSPIVSVHLWFTRNFMRHLFVGLVGRRIQWVFNRSAISHEPQAGGHVSTVISAAHAYVSHTNEELVRIALEDLRSTYGGIVEDPRHAVVIREKRATMSPTPAAEPLRPPQKTPYPNLFLAGDWTATGLPATIEGAILSAEHCVTGVSTLLGAVRT